MERYDFILAGGGVAGLSLAHHLLRASSAGKRILIVDRSFTTRNDCALSFWAQEPTPYEPIVSRTWSRLKIAVPGFVREDALPTLRYQTMRALDFYDFIYDALDTVPTVTRLQANVTNIEDGPDGATVWLDDRPYHAAWAFDSRFNHCDFRPAPEAICLWQHFSGWEIITRRDCFDPYVATLMDLRLPPGQPRRGDWRFFYVLPYTAHRALVELVSLDGEGATEALHAYIKGHLGIDDYQVVRREAGVTPLTDHVFPRRLDGHVMAIGTLGGCIKPSTGYGFQRMQADAAAICRSLQVYGHPFAVPDTPRFFRFCDRVMLRTLARRGEWALPLFSALLQHNPLQRVLHFVDETASPAEIAPLSASLIPRVVSLAFSTLSASQNATPGLATGASQRRSS